MADLRIEEMPQQVNHGVGRASLEVRRGKIDLTPARCGSSVLVTCRDKAGGNPAKGDYDERTQPSA
jgi:hypothetical protein